MTEHIAKLQIIKELANSNETKQVCEVLIDYIKSNQKKGIGFQK